MQHELIQLEDYFLSHFHVDFHFPEKTEEVPISWSLDFDYDTFRDKQHITRRMLGLEVSGKCLGKDNKPIGLTFDIEIRGIFHLPESMDEEHQEGLLRINGVSILYSTLRGILGNVSGSFPGGRFCLPTISPKEIVESVEARKKQSSFKATTKPVPKKTVKKKARKKTKQ